LSVKAVVKVCAHRQQALGRSDSAMTSRPGPVKACEFSRCAPSPVARSAPLPIESARRGCRRVHRRATAPPSRRSPSTRRTPAAATCSPRQPAVRCSPALARRISRACHSTPDATADP
jgi:hypothetical protein